MRDEVSGFWNKKPCGTFGLIPENPRADYFRKIKERRYKLEPFVLDFIDELDVRSKKILEIGCGVGTDGVEIAWRGADYTAIDASRVSLGLAEKNFKLCGLSGVFLNASAEDMPFPESSFDAVYSWGVLHHTPDMEKAVREVRRVMKPGGEFCIMLYNRFSLVGLQLYALFGLLHLDPSASLKKLFAEHHESPGTKALTDSEAFDLFGSFKNVSVQNIVTPYDLRIARGIYMPRWFGAVVPARFGFFKVIKGSK
ncbi:MAG: methyltransferase domain-containing protein [Candidatus Brennerbacteria bacterium]